MHKVTLSMPVYNVEKYVERALLSVLNQTFESIEYLIVDDKGTDDSMDVVREIIATHPRGKDVRIIDHGVNQGLGAARNSAIKGAKGEYLYCMDSDDEITKDCIEILYNKMQENPVDFVAASHARKDTQGKTIEEFRYKDYILKDTEKSVAHIYYFDKINISIATWNKLYDIKFLRNNEISCFPKHLNEDALFTFQIILDAKTCILISNITYFYNMTPESIMHDYKFKRTKEKDAFLVRQDMEIVNFMKKYIETYKYSMLYSYTLIHVMITSYRFVDFTINTFIKNKQRYINQLVNYPLKFHEIRLLNHKRLIHYYFYFIGVSPYWLQFISVRFFLKLFFLRKKLNKRVLLIKRT
ncbi:putative glycosyltransferase EpsH [termite gut metagenome]|uniref:Putative glycosyltransferase EpsH n=1 Tax=termite gut metagenome TaxID=433724 RepID=A0A5J4S8D0_9ZZZZ